MRAILNQISQFTSKRTFSIKKKSLSDIYKI